MSLVIDLIDLVAKHKSGELRCPATALIHGPLTLLIFTSKLGFSTPVIAVNVKPCIDIVIDIPFKHTP